MNIPILEMRKLRPGETKEVPGVAGLGGSRPRSGFRPFIPLVPPPTPCKRPGRDPATFHRHPGLVSPRLLSGLNTNIGAPPLSKRKGFYSINLFPQIPGGPRLTGSEARRNYNHVAQRSWPGDLPRPLHGDIIE